MRGLLEALGTEADRVVVDMEAGLEHLKRGTARPADVLLIVLEPYYRSLETAARVHRLAAELGIPRIWAVANKVRTAQDREGLHRFCERSGLELAAVIPYDETVVEAERAGRAPIDHDPNGKAVAEIGVLARRLG